MKARINWIESLPKKQQRKVFAQMEDMAEKSVREQQTASVRRWHKLLLLVLNREFGFGLSRLLRATAAFDELMDERQNDPELWAHADKRLKQLGIEIPEERGGNSD